MILFLPYIPMCIPPKQKTSKSVRSILSILTWYSQESQVEASVSLQIPGSQEQGRLRLYLPHMVFSPLEAGTTWLQKVPFVVHEALCTILVPDGAPAILRNRFFLSDPYDSSPIRVNLGHHVVIISARTKHVTPVFPHFLNRPSTLYFRLIT